MDKDLILELSQPDYNGINPKVMIADPKNLVEVKYRDRMIMIDVIEFLDSSELERLAEDYGIRKDINHSRTIHLLKKKIRGLPILDSDYKIYYSDNICMLISLSIFLVIATLALLVIIYIAISYALS